jgi:hypothetical protein
MAPTQKIRHPPRQIRIYCRGYCRSLVCKVTSLRIYLRRIGEVSKQRHDFTFSTSVALIAVPYRPHIDGLRAIAVLAVILFHFGWATLPGGFLGVDIFFVISGFLITQLLSEPSDLSWRGRLGSFYLRRARRILPALLFTSLVLAAAAVVIYLPDGLTNNSKYFLLTPLMLANVAAGLDGDYFATGNYFPLKHYWSLAVEEQFYVVYPLIQVLTQPDHLPRDAEYCMSLPLTRVAAGELCRIGPEHTGLRKAVLWGDSHALVLLPAFEWLAQSNDIQIYFAGRSSCKPLLDVANGLGGTTQNENCAAFNNAMAAAVQRIRPEVHHFECILGPRKRTGC